MEKKKQPRCHNCKHSGAPFKRYGITHHHCEHPVKYSEEKWDKGEWCAWDLLKEFWNTCDFHEF
jgi:hypothetical protein